MSKLDKISFKAILYILLCATMLLASCNEVEQKYLEKPPLDDTLRSLTITWDKQARKISHSTYFAEYPRLQRMNGDTLLLTYHFGKKTKEWNNIAICQSIDNGRNWKIIQVLTPKTRIYEGYCTPTLLLLKNKTVLLAYTARGYKGDTAINHLQIRASVDGGKRWSNPKDVIEGLVWEPGLVQLNDGEIELFYTKEFVGNKSSEGRPEQSIMMTSSNDSGQNWTEPSEVAFTKGKRDGMPVPLVLNDNKGIIFAVEAVNNETSPEIMWSSVKTRWRYPELSTVENGRRWYAGIDPIWGGAPSIIQLPTGETIIAMQTEGGRKIERYTGWKKNTIQVMVGNSIAKNFRDISYPWPQLPTSEGAYFCSIFLKDPQTLALISTRNFTDGHSEIWWKEGNIQR